MIGYFPFSPADDTVDHTRHILCHRWSSSINFVLHVFLSVCVESISRKMGCPSAHVSPSLGNHTMCCSDTDCVIVCLLCHVRIPLHFISMEYALVTFGIDPFICVGLGWFSSPLAITRCLIVLMICTRYLRLQFMIPSTSSMAP